jgi:hypothetical protein
MPVTRVIVINCDLTWSDWPRQLRSRAIDLYPTREHVDFWMIASRAPEGQQEAERRIWGDWPRFVEPDALLGDLGDAIEALERAEGERLVVIFVLGHPREMAGASESPMDLPTLLQQLADRQVAGRPGRATRLLRILAFRRGAEDGADVLDDALDALPGGAAMPGGQAAIADAAVFLSPPGLDRDGEQAVTRASTRIFDALRLTIDLARDSDAAGKAGQGWRLLWPQPRARRMALWLKPPQDGAVRADPSAELRARILAFVEPRRNDQGTDRVGQAMADLAALDRAVTEMIEQGRPAEAGERHGPSAESLPKPPDVPDLRAVDAWLAETRTKLEAIRRNVRQKVSQALEALDPTLVRRAGRMEEAAQGINIVTVGLTDTAQKRLGDLLERVTKERGEAARQAEEARTAVMEHAAKLGLSAKDEENPVSPAQAELIEAHRAWRVQTARYVPPEAVLAGVLVATAGLYVLLAAHVRALLSPDPPLLLVLALDEERVRLLLPALFLLCGLAVGIFLQRALYARWRASRTAAQDAADELARALDRLTQKSAVYAERAAIAGDLEPLENRLRRIRNDLAPPAPGQQREFDRQVDALDTVIPRPVLPDEDRIGFENRMQGMLARERLDDWMARILAQSNAPEPEPLTICFPSRPNLTLLSRMRLMDNCVVDADQLVAGETG